MYSCVLRINYTNLDIRILHTLMYQIDLRYTDTLLSGVSIVTPLQYVSVLSTVMSIAKLH